MYSQINISSGHSINCQGASDVINEVTEARKVVDRIYEICQLNNIECYKYHDTSSNSRTNLANISNWHNQFKDGIDVSIHFNASKHTSSPMGTECWYVSQGKLSNDITKAISNASGLRNRGGKQTNKLYVLNHTIKPMILIEICFCDSIADCTIYNSRFDDICCAIVRTLTGKSITLNKQNEIKKEEIKKEDNKSMYIFSQNWYLYKYPDVAKSKYKDNPYIHYIEYGKKEGRLAIPPIPKEYKEREYLELNPDIALAVEKGTFSSGIHHYIMYGFKENRKVCK